MCWCAHKTATLTSIQHTVGGSENFQKPAYVIFEWFPSYRSARPEIILYDKIEYEIVAL